MREELEPHVRKEKVRGRYAKVEVNVYISMI